MVEGEGVGGVGVLYVNEEGLPVGRRHRAGDLGARGYGRQADEVVEGRLVEAEVEEVHLAGAVVYAAGDAPPGGPVEVLLDHEELDAVDLHDVEAVGVGEVLIGVVGFGGALGEVGAALEVDGEGIGDGVVAPDPPVEVGVVGTVGALQPEACGTPEVVGVVYGAGGLAAGEARAGAVAAGLGEVDVVVGRVDGHPLDPVEHRGPLGRGYGLLVEEVVGAPDRDPVEALLIVLVGEERPAGEVAGGLGDEHPEEARRRVGAEVHDLVGALDRAALEGLAAPVVLLADRAGLAGVDLDHVVEVLVLPQGAPVELGELRGVDREVGRVAHALVVARAGGLREARLGLELVGEAPVVDGGVRGAEPLLGRPDAPVHPAGDPAAVHAGLPDDAREVDAEELPGASVAELLVDDLEGAVAGAADLEDGHPAAVPEAVVAVDLLVVDRHPPEVIGGVIRGEADEVVPLLGDGLADGVAVGSRRLDDVDAADEEHLRRQGARREHHLRGDEAGRERDLLVEDRLRVRRGARGEEEGGREYSHHTWILVDVCGAKEPGCRYGIVSPVLVINLSNYHKLDKIKLFIHSLYA